MTTQLKRELGLSTAIAMVMGESIALGIFLTPAAMAKSLGSPLLLLAVWAAMAVMALAGALCYAELAAAMPEVGGLYVYLRRFFGDVPAFLYGWMSLAVMDCGLSAALAVGAVAYINALAPSASHIPARLIAAAILLAIALVNVRGTRLSGTLLAIVNALKLGVLALLILWGVFGHAGSTSNLQPFVARHATADPLFAALAGAFISAFFSFGGWWDVSKLAGEVRDPQRTVPRAMLFGVVGVGLVYSLLSVAFLYVVPLASVNSNEAFVAQFGEALFGRIGASILAACVLVCVIGGLWALMMAAPRVYFAMAEKGEMFASIGRTWPRYGTPANAILLQLACSLLALFIGGFQQIIAYVIFMAVLFLALTASAVFRLESARERWWYPFAPILFILCSVAVAGMILMNNPRQAVLGAVVVASGYPLHLWMRHRYAAPLSSAHAIKEEYV